MLLKIESVGVFLPSGKKSSDRDGRGGYPYDTNLHFLRPDHVHVFISVFISGFISVFPLSYDEVERDHRVLLESYDWSAGGKKWPVRALLKKHAISRWVSAREQDAGFPVKEHVHMTFQHCRECCHICRLTVIQRSIVWTANFLVLLKFWTSYRAKYTKTSLSMPDIMDFHV